MNDLVPFNQDQEELLNTLPGAIMPYKVKQDYSNSTDIGRKIQY